MAFGKKPKAEEKKAQAGGDGGGSITTSQFPWAGWPDEIGCNFALGHLQRNLSAPFVVDGRLHAETLVAAAGAVAGWAAHRSLVADPIAVRKAEAAGQMALAELSDGRKLLYGDAINDMLVAHDAATAQQRVWNMVAGAAIGAGLPPDQLPDLNAMFGHVAKSWGGPGEGMPTTQNKPGAPAGELLRIAAPVARDCLTGEISEITRSKGFAASETSWVAVTAWAAAGVVRECAGVMAPRDAVSICMESAIYTSKLMSPGV